MESTQLNCRTIEVDKQDAHVNYIDKLSHDCLVKVLRCIPAIERLEMEKVCRKWKEATKFSWHSSRKIVIDKPIIKQEEKTILRNRWPYLRHLTISAVPHPWLYEIIKNKCQNITHFDITLDNDDEINSSEKILRVITSMPKLKYLKLDVSFNPATNLCAQIFDRLPNHIEEINVTVDKKVEFPPGSLERLNGLRCLTLQRFLLTDGTIQSILRNKNTLVYLDLSECKFLTNNASSMFSELNNLEHLNLRHIGNLIVDTVIKIAHNCPKLKHFEFQSLSNYTHDTFFRTAIISPNMCFQLYITDKSFINPHNIPFRFYRELKYLVDLEYLNIAEVIGRGDDNESLLSNTANNWKNLKYLNIGNGNNFSASDIKEIIKFKKLEYVYLPSENIGLQLFKDIAINCSELKILNVSFQRNYSKKNLGKLSNLKKLEKLYQIQIKII